MPTLRLAIDTRLITSRYTLPLVIDRPGRLLVEVTDGTTAFNAAEYRISVNCYSAKVAVNRLAFSQGQELALHGATAIAIAALAVDTEWARRNQHPLTSGDLAHQ